MWGAWESSIKVHSVGMKTIACIIGTRPQLIKHSVLLNELKQSFHIQTINTLQHYQADLNDIFLKELYLDTDFNELEPSSSHSSIRLGAMIIELSRLLEKIKPNYVLVYGDTDSTLAGALAASKRNIPLIHVEAGERSFNKQMPEEINRLATDALAQIHFCSSMEAIQNLKEETIWKQVFLCGDVMKDLLLRNCTQLKRPIKENYIYCTIHRNYNKNNPEKLTELLIALNETKHKVVMPVHPATVLEMKAHQIDPSAYANILVMQPLSYLQSLSYQKFADAIVTDSGGIQKEAYWLRKRCITIRKETEWKGTLRGRWNQLLYDNLEKLAAMLNSFPIEEEYDPELYGNGNAAKNIREILVKLV